MNIKNCGCYEVMLCHKFCKKKIVKQIITKAILLRSYDHAVLIIYIKKYINNDRSTAVCYENCYAKTSIQRHASYRCRYSGYPESQLWFLYCSIQRALNRIPDLHLNTAYYLALGNKYTVTKVNDNFWRILTIVYKFYCVNLGQFTFVPRHLPNLCLCTVIWTVSSAFFSL